MKVFVAALAFAVVAAVGVAMVLNAIQEPSYVAFRPAAPGWAIPARI
jgi:hypothetical protein